MKNKDQILKWLNGELTPEELDDLRKTEDYRQLKPIIEQSAHFETPHFDEEAHYKKLKEKMASRQLEPRESFDRSLYFKIAAVFVVIFATGLLLFMNEEEKIFTETSEVTLLELPDNSSVVLNYNSQISYFPKKWDRERSLNLTGEAFFSVEKGSEFTVITSNGEIRVLGTEFTVSSRNGNLEVWCYEGAVKVSFRQKEFILKENQSFSGTGDLDSGIINFNEKIPAWAVQETKFEAAPLREVIRELEQQFGVEISSRNVDLDQLFTGSFSHTDIKLALKSVTIPLQLKFKAASENKILLYEE